MKQPESFKFLSVKYFILVNSENYYWDGRDWTTAEYNAKHYLTWAAASAAQWQLRQNKKFKQFKTNIKPIS